MQHVNTYIRYDSLQTSFLNLLSTLAQPLHFTFSQLVIQANDRQTRQNRSSSVVQVPWFLHAVHSADPQTWMPTGPSAVWAPLLSSAGRPKSTLKHKQWCETCVCFLKPTKRATILLCAWGPWFRRATTILTDFVQLKVQGEGFRDI